MNLRDGSWRLLRIVVTCCGNALCVELAGSGKDGWPHGI